MGALHFIYGPFTSASAHIPTHRASKYVGFAVRYWIQAEDEDFDRELRRAELAGDPLPEGISMAGRATIAAMIGAQVAVLAALLVLILDWLRT